MLQWRASRKGREKWREEGLAERGLVRLGKGGGAGVGQKEGARTGVVGWPLAHLGSGPLPRAQTKFFLFFFNFLCRGPLARPSANIPFAEGQARPSAKIFFGSVGGEFGPLADLGLGPFPRAQIQGPRQRFFYFFKKNSLPRATGQALGKEPSAIFFGFLAQFFCGSTIHCFELNFKI